MTSIANIFQQRQAFIAYITAGQGGQQMTEEVALALIAGGVDILEIGVPFSDPIADGPVIQQAMTQALAQKTHFATVLSIVERIKQQRPTTPIVLFSYYNPLFSRGLAQSIRDAASAGVDALLVVDLPWEEATACHHACQQSNIAPIPLIAPTTSEQRIALLSRDCRAFLYYVCRNGTTGLRQTLPDHYPQQLQTIKKAANRVPVAAGFGIANRDMAAAALRYADGFVVGSRFVKAITEGESAEALHQLALSIDPRNSEEPL